MNISACHKYKVIRIV